MTRDGIDEYNEKLYSTREFHRRISGYRYTDYHSFIKFLQFISEVLIKVEMTPNCDWEVTMVNNFGVTVTQVFRTGI